MTTYIRLPRCTGQSQRPCTNHIVVRTHYNVEITEGSTSLRLSSNSGATILSSLRKILQDEGIRAAMQYNLELTPLPHHFFIHGHGPAEVTKRTVATMRMQGGADVTGRADCRIILHRATAKPRWCVERRRRRRRRPFWSCSVSWRCLACGIISLWRLWIN